MTHAIRIQNLGKSYLLMHRAAGVGQYTKLSDVLVQRAKAALGLHTAGAAQDSKETFWALDDVSFDVNHGERVGIIGRNGAGKSTLLKIISRISAPSRGRIEIAGRVSSLLEVGTGFHPELTGRENIFLNGAVLGMSRADIRQRFDEIVQFAEVERFLDTPVKRYSSGMYMRLAFAVAAHLEPDILIVDEVLAVGDAAFQKKCLGKMRQVGSEGRTVLFVSHNMGAISEFCSRAVLLDNGRVAADGTPALIIPKYASAGEQGGGAGTFMFDDKGVSACHIRRVVIADKTGQSGGHFEMSGDISITVEYVVREYLPELQMTVTVSGDAHDVFHAFDNDEDQEIVGTQPGVYTATYTIPSMTLREGLYSLRVTGGVPTELLSDVSGGLTFEVVNHAISALKKSFRSDRTGIVVSPGHWEKSQIAEFPESSHE